MYIELFRWHTCGQGEAEQAVLSLVEPGNVVAIRGKMLYELIRLKNKRTDEQPIVFLPNPKASYKLYYNYHPNSGYRTVFATDGSFDILRPTGGTLSAFFSEVVVLEERGKIIAFPQK